MVFVARMALLPLLLAGVAPGHAAPANLPGDDAVVAISDAALYRKCRSKARKAYGPVKGRHSSSIRLATIYQCVDAGGRLP
jgi:hypothetical protein